MQVSIDKVAMQQRVLVAGEVYRKVSTHILARVSDGHLLFDARLFYDERKTAIEVPIVIWGKEFTG